MLQLLKNMWQRARFRKSPATIWIISVCAVVIIVQLVFPSGRALPFSTVADEAVGYATKTQISKQLAKDYKDVAMQFTVSGETVRSTAAKSGLLVNTEAAAMRATQYPWWQRLIPFSIVIKGAVTDVPVYLRVDKAHFSEFAKTALPMCRKEPLNAGVQMVNGKVEISHAKEGYECDLPELQQQLTKTAITKDSLVVTVPLKVLRPSRSDKDVASVLNSAKSALARSLSLTAGGAPKQVPAAGLAQWVRFPGKQDGTLMLAIDPGSVSSYVKAAHANVIVAPKATVVTTLDGVETGRAQGVPGKQIDEAQTVMRIEKNWLQSTQKSSTAEVAVKDVAPPVRYQRSYSSTQAGLQALLNDLAKDKGDYAIAVRRANGEATVVNGSKQYHPASTYKMFVAWAVLKRIEAGQMKWTDTAEGGRTVESCFEVMIVNSDNPCGEWLGVKIGWTNLNNQLKGIGLSCTNLSSAWLSCAQDETLFLSKLESGQILTGESRAKLLDAMKRQVYRSGIPAGVGTAVADKVGFISGYLHDAAIVYASGGTYQLTIMTKGSSWSQIADAARQINAQLQRM